MVYQYYSSVADPKLLIRIQLFILIRILIPSRIQIQILLGFISNVGSQKEASNSNSYLNFSTFKFYFLKYGTGIDNRQYLKITTCMIMISNKTRAVDPHSLYADPDPAVFLNADPDPDPDPDPGPA